MDGLREFRLTYIRGMKHLLAVVVVLSALGVACESLPRLQNPIAPPTTRVATGTASPTPAATPPQPTVLKATVGDLKPSESGAKWSISIPYCVSYVLEGQQAEKCVSSLIVGPDLAAALGPATADATKKEQAAKSKAITDCFNQAVIGKPLPDCWRDGSLR